MTDKEIYEKATARAILSVIEMVCLSKEFAEFRYHQGARGQREYIINWIKDTYNIE